MIREEIPKTEKILSRRGKGNESEGGKGNESEGGKGNEREGGKGNESVGGKEERERQDGNGWETS